MDFITHSEKIRAGLRQKRKREGQPPPAPKVVSSADISIHGGKIRAGLRKAIAEGRKPGRPKTVSDEKIESVMHMTTAKAAATVRLSPRQFINRRTAILEQRAKEPEQNG